MFDKLIDFLISLLDKILPWFVVKQFDNGIILRCGKYTKTFQPGIYWKIPFLDEVMTHHIVITLLSIPVQSLTTKDGQQVVIKGVVKFKVENVKLLLLDVYDATDAISDITQSIIKKQVHIRNWEECNNDDLDNEITKKLRLEVKKWGISVESVTLTDMGLSPSFRLFNEQIKHI